MDSFAKLPTKERQTYFQETASQRGLTTTVIEKDFWVCWILKHLFALEGIPELRFKGGTSLSKVYQLIQRFSEDIDISLNRADLGFHGTKNPAQPGLSITKRKELNKQLGNTIESMVKDQILIKLKAAVESILGPDGWKLIPSVEANEEMTLEFDYPASFVYQDYLRPKIKIEFGRGDQQPCERLSIRPYLAEQFPDAFVDPVVTIGVLTCERTFWEKVTLLHAEYHRQNPTSMKSRMSRHWYDIAAMSTDPRFADNELDEVLLHEVITFKDTFYPSSWASYASAVPGTLLIVPHKDLAKILREDYKQMQEMIWGEKISFEEILVRLQKLEDRINARKAPPATESSKR